MVGIVFKIYYHGMSILKKIFLCLIYGHKLSIGKHTTFRKSFSVLILGAGQVRIGRNCFFNHHTSICAKGIIHIGDRTIFGENVKMYDHNHRFSKDMPLKQQGYSIGKIQIGSDCWIGSNVVLLKGADIGDHCVIGAGCIVNGKIPDWTLVRAGNCMNTLSPIKREDHGE